MSSKAYWPRSSSEVSSPKLMAAINLLAVQYRRDSASRPVKAQFPNFHPCCFTSLLFSCGDGLS
ncbi:hypothetical protein SAMN05216411_10935 [Nitrosospira multiformis]|nr:hypothetical protein SAMN05216411_10935 [Nitrosospira multiformis]